jgi:hypothetical protein
MAKKSKNAVKTGKAGKAVKADKGSKSAAKSKKSASARIARELREAGEPMLELVANPVMGELVAAALVAGAQALVAGKPAREVAETLADDGEPAGRKGAEMSSLLGYAVAVAAGEIATRLISTYEAKAGGGKAAETAAKAGRKAADTAWNAVGKAGKAGKSRRPSPNA